MPLSSSERADVVLAGGGLANSLIALRLKGERPALRIVMVEQAPGRDVSHTWSFFHSDVSAASLDRLRPLLEGCWEGYAVRFRSHARRLSSGYASMSSERLGAAVEGALGPDLLPGVRVSATGPRQVTLEDGRTLEADLVVDGRGQRSSEALQMRWQVFRGLEVELDAPCGLDAPIVMDAAVPQLGGYRFLYVLPFTPQRLLIEDTRYADGPELDEAELDREIAAYAARQGWRVTAVRRRESGVLPVVLSGDIGRFWREQPQDVPVSGMRAALFHPTTGYSLPDAVALAEMIVGSERLESAAVAEAIRARSVSLWRRRGFYRALNRMLFLAAAPERRVRVLERFYRLPQPLIERFYAGETTALDQLRLLSGKPPVPIGRALRALASKGVREAPLHA